MGLSRGLELAERANSLPPNPLCSVPLQPFLLHSAEPRTAAATVTMNHIEIADPREPCSLAELVAAVVPWCCGLSLGRPCDCSDTTPP